eukprot:2980994-Rhodomonas_salina.1
MLTCQDGTVAWPRSVSLANKVPFPGHGTRALRNQTQTHPAPVQRVPLRGCSHLNSPPLCRSLCLRSLATVSGPRVCSYGPRVCSRGTTRVLRPR